MKRSRLLLILTGLALALFATALLPAGKAVAKTNLKPLLQLAPKPVVLGPVQPGETSDSASVKVFNAGNPSVSIAKTTIAAPFDLVSDGCTGQTLISGQSCFVTVNFTPAKKGKYKKPLLVYITGVKAPFKVSANGAASLATPSSPPTSPTSPTPPSSPTPTPTPIVAPATAGDVLILGGYASLPVIYDPASSNSYDSGNPFVDGASTDLLPENFQSVALPDGKVLIAGGDDGSSAYANAYIYDPASQTVAATTPMNKARTQFTLTLLNDGTVIAAGGSSRFVNPTLQDKAVASVPLTSAEIYNEASKTWAAEGSLSVARLAHAATLMPNGTVLVSGGLTSSSSLYALATDYEIYSPSSKSWTSTLISQPSIVPRYGHAAVLLDDGSVLVAGGLVPVQNSSSTTVAGDAHYIPGSGWATPGKENDERYDAAISKLASGDVLIAGGIDSTGNPVSTAEIFSASGLSWTTTSGTLPSAASGQAAALMADGRVLIAGGTSSEAVSYDRTTNVFVAGGSLQSGAFSGAGSAVAIVQSAINVMPVGVGPGIDNVPAPGFQNIPYTSVKVCVAGSTTNCRVVNGIVLDTGSVGLRLFASKLQGSGFSPLAVSGGGLGECFNFIASVAWGSVAQADIYMGGEVAKNTPIQVMDDLNRFSPIPSGCNPGGLPVLSSPSALAAGANGVLGIGDLPNDLNGDVTYYSCANNTCAILSTPGTFVLNPVSNIHSDVSGAGSTDYNGVALSMNTVPSGGQAADYGNLALGIGPAANDTAGASVQVFLANSSGFMEAQLGNTTLPAYLDTGTNAYAFNAIPAISQCSSNNPPNGPWYCPASTLLEQITNEGFNGSPKSTPAPFSVGNAQQLSQNGVWTEPEMAGPIASLFDWGMPFFYGRTVYIGVGPAYLSSSFTSVDAPFFAYQ